MFDRVEWIAVSEPVGLAMMLVAVAVAALFQARKVWRALLVTSALERVMRARISQLERLPKLERSERA